MQVATLFRESATLLGATMEAGGGGANSPDSASSGGLAVGSMQMSYASTFANHTLIPVTINNKYKLNMKVEPHDDGYETSADLLLSNTANINRKIKCEKLEDPYSFIDDDPMPLLPLPPGYMNTLPSVNHLAIGPKKRGRKKKIKEELDSITNLNGGIPRAVKERKKHDRFNGMPEEEVSKRTLPDHLAANLDIIIIGINPGLFAAYKGHHYAGPGNHFWKCLYLSGLTKEQMSADEDYTLLQVGIGFTNMVQRPTKGSADLTRKEIKEGSQILLEKLRKFRPKIAVFNGKLIYEVFSGKKDFHFGRQPDCIEGTSTHMWVMPSSSARCAQLPRAADKVPFYAGLKKFRDYLNGLISNIDESEMIFSEPTLKACYEPEPKPDPDLIDLSNSVIKKEDGNLVQCKKKRGRPKKIKTDGEEPRKQIIRRTPSHSSGNCDFPKKKRGRPKKVKLEEREQPTSTVPVDNSVSININRCFSNPSPIHSSSSYYHIPADITSNSGSTNLYAPQSATNYSQSPRSTSYGQSPRPQYSQSPRPQYSQSPRPPYSQSPRPHSQSFTHSDLSSEISAAISSEQLGSPSSPGLGPPDFEPPSNMADDVDCHFNSPASSTPSEQAHYPYPSSYSVEPLIENHYSAPRQPQDIASKSLSGLESLVDQIPSITEGDSTLTDSSEQFTSGHYTNANYNMPARTSPVPFSYSPSSGYPIYPTPTWTGHYEPMSLAYPQLPYAQGYAPSLHVPNPNYPYYSYPQPTPAHPPGYPPYLGGF